MIGRVILIAILLTALGAGAAMYYLQVYAYYEELTPEGAGPVTLVPQGQGTPEAVATADLRAIDSDSSPIRFRSCFALAEPFEAEAWEGYANPEPPNAPGWFDCFDAREIGEAIEAGEAAAFLGQKDARYGIDRVVAVFPDGRGYSWPQINACGEVVFRGEPAPEGCPPVPESTE